MGPLQGLRIIEMAGIGPAPFATMLLSDMGAEVIRIDRKPAQGGGQPSQVERMARQGILNRGRRSLAIDLKQPSAVQVLLQLATSADALLEGFRPGVMERLGLGPQACLERNPALVYGRITGWGQTGPLASTAGHDINYIALSGALHSIGEVRAPLPPLNLVGDFGGGGMLVAFGIVCALLEARASGRGQVVDAAMTDGAALLMAMPYSFRAMGHWSDQRQSNWLDGSAPFYGTYACADGKWLAVGPIEAQFHAALLRGLGLAEEEFAGRTEPQNWARLRARLAETFAGRTRAQWCEVFAGTDACVTPVLDLDEAPRHTHNQARGTFVFEGGVAQPAPAPRFSRTAPSIQGPPPLAGEHSLEILRDWGITPELIDRLGQDRAI